MEKGERELDIPLHCNSSYGLVIRNERARVNIPEEDQQKIIDSVTTGDHGKKKLERKQPKQAEMTEIGPTYDKPAAEADDHHLYIQGRNLVSIRGQDQSCKQPISEGSRTSLQESDILLQENPIYFAHWQQIKQTIRRGKKLKQSKHKKTECLIITMLIPAFLLTFLSILFSLLLFSSVHSQSQMNLTADSEDVSVFNNSSIQVNVSFQLNATFRILNQKLNNLSLQLNYSQTPDDSSKLVSLFTRVASLSDSIQQLEVKVTNTCSALSQQHSIIEPVELDELGNQTCPPNITELNQPADVTIDISDQCIVQGGQVCTVNPGFFCRTTVVAFNEEDKVLMDFSCYATFMDGSSGTPNATAVILQDTIVDTSPDQDITSTVLSSTMQTLSCHCLSFEDTKLSCRYFARHCNSTKGTVESVINILS